MKYRFPIESESEVFFKNRPITEEARGIVYGAGVCAMVRQESSTRPEHLLLALMQHLSMSDPVMVVLERFDITDATLKKVWTRWTVLGKLPALAPYLRHELPPMDDALERVLNKALQNSYVRPGVRREYISAEDLLVGLALESKNLVAELFLSKGVDYVTLRRELSHERRLQAA